MTPNQMLRLFIAVDIPDAIRATLEQARSALDRDRPPVKWVAGSSIHLTLQFLGDVEAARSEALIDGLSRATRGIDPFELCLQGVGCFPGFRRPRVVWVGLGGALEPLARLQRQVVAETRALGFEPESRPWSPHLTLGRVREHAGHGAVEQLGQRCARPDFAPEGRWEVSRVALIRSELLPAGARYTVLGEAHLRGVETGRT